MLLVEGGEYGTPLPKVWCVRCATGTKSSESQTTCVTCDKTPLLMGQLNYEFEFGSTYLLRNFTLTCTLFDSGLSLLRFWSIVQEILSILVKIVLNYALKRKFVKQNSINLSVF